MITPEQVKARLDEVLVPHVVRSLPSMNLIRDITVTDQGANITLASTALDVNTEDWITGKIKEALSGLPGINNVQIEYVDAKASEVNKVRRVIAVMSGKGGVGKSLVTGLTAVALRRRGYEVGILDADITGPSIPKMFGIVDRPGGNDTCMLPVTTKTGIEVMSINLLLPNEDEAVIWRGPLIGRAITQFWEEVLWGNLDYLIVDLPPGTSDAPLTVLQSLPISGVVIVFTPQDLTAMIVRKAVNMARQMDKRVLGVVENMSYLFIPEINKNIEIFGKSRAEEMAISANSPLIGRLPIDPALAMLCDEGQIEHYDSDIMTDLGESILRSISSDVSTEQK
jgi:Mrp family chromosome partitioning ATPase